MHLEAVSAIGDLGSSGVFQWCRKTKAYACTQKVWMRGRQQDGCLEAEKTLSSFMLSCDMLHGSSSIHPRLVLGTSGYRV